MRRTFFTVFMIFCIGIGHVLSQDFIQIKGSDTLINLVQRLSEVYMEQNPNTAIAVTGGGSGVGIAALIADRVQIANASRPMKESEYEAAEENGVHPYELVIGIDGLSVIVNSANSITSLTMDQIGAIFRGEILNWQEIGGSDTPISLYGRQPNSGTFVFFQEHVLGNKDYSQKMKQMNGNAQIVEGVIADKAAIGYVGIGYVYDDNANIREGLTVLSVAAETGAEPVTPLDSENVKSGIYPIARALYQYVNGKPEGAVRDFIAFELGPEGQRIVEEMSFYPVSGQYLENNKEAGF
ncbi:PstS family phosphate ABC transporter substrate-binding protein [bacterium]|nr:PstS family phosphate ABC transporter substrate-binding protein [bacterium]RQV93259.1 MAG: PstS family phosphate ABC transporter substrate-binding protein [bacterium]